MAVMASDSSYLSTRGGIQLGTYLVYEANAAVLELDKSWAPQWQWLQVRGSVAARKGWMDGRVERWGERDMGKVGGGE